GLRRAGVETAVGRTAVVGKNERDRRCAVRTVCRCVGQPPRRIDGGRDGEQGRVRVAGDAEGQRLGRFVGRARRDGGGPGGDRLRAGILAHALVRALRERRRVV